MPGPENCFRGRAWEWTRRVSGFAMPRLGPPLHGIFQLTRPEHIRTEIVPGVRMSLDLAEHTSHNIYYLGRRYEYPTLPILHDWLNRGATHFFDIGANFGYFSLALAQPFSHVRFTAFEPNPETFCRLETIVRENGITNIECQRLALSDRRAQLDFLCDPENSGASHVITATAPSPGTGMCIQVPAMTFDEWCPRAARTGMRAIAKIDAEGHEASILAGMQESLRAGHFLGVCLEFNPDVQKREGDHSAAVMATLREHGFRHLAVDAVRKRYGSYRTENHFFTLEE